jgi:hypothetical protein
MSAEPEPNLSGRCDALYEYDREPVTEDRLLHVHCHGLQ